MNQSISQHSNSSRNQKLHQLLKSKPNISENISDARICNDIAFSLYNLRLASGLTQKKLAEKLGVKQSNVSRWEQAGYQGYKVKILNKIVRTLNGKLEVIITPATNNYFVNISFDSKMHKNTFSYGLNKPSYAYSGYTLKDGLTFHSIGEALYENI